MSFNFSFLKAMLKTGQQFNQWFKFPPFKVYLKYPCHVLTNGVDGPMITKNALVLGNINSTQQGSGKYRDFLKELESAVKAYVPMLRIEVTDPKHAHIYEELGFHADHGSSSGENADTHYDKIFPKEVKASLYNKGEEDFSKEDIHLNPSYNEFWNLFNQHDFVRFILCNEGLLVWVGTKYIHNQVIERYKFDVDFKGILERYDQEKDINMVLNPEPGKSDAKIEHDVLNNKHIQRVMKNHEVIIPNYPQLKVVVFDKEGKPTIGQTKMKGHDIHSSAFKSELFNKGDETFDQEEVWLNPSRDKFWAMYAKHKSLRFMMTSGGLLAWSGYNYTHEDLHNYIEKTMPDLKVEATGSFHQMISDQHGNLPHNADARLDFMGVDPDKEDDLLKEFIHFPPVERVLKNKTITWFDGDDFQHRFYGDKELKALDRLAASLNRRENIHNRRRKRRMEEQLTTQCYDRMLLEIKASLTETQLKDIFTIFQKSYTEATGKSHSFEWFKGRAAKWTFYPKSNKSLDGFVAVREQRSGFLKLVGAAGNPRTILKGFLELNNEHKPVWGAVSKEIQEKLLKAGYKTPPAFIIKQLMPHIPSEVFGGHDIKVNKDGSLSFTDPEIGEVTKFFIGNTAYYKALLEQLNSEKSPIPKVARWPIKIAVEKWLKV